MSRFNDPTVRPMFASKTTFDALAVDSGEESEEEPITEPETAPESLLQPKKLTKSAIKKANRLARLERKQRQKLKQGSEEEQPGASIASPQPVTAVIVEKPLHLPLSLPSNSLPLEQISLPQEALQTPLDESLPAAAGSFDVPPIGIAAQDPPTRMPMNVPVPVVKEDYLEKYMPRNGSVTISVAQDNKVSRQDPETAKKRQNALTRLLLLGHAYMILLVMLCQTLVYREVTALFSLKTAAPESPDAEAVKGKDPWSKTLNWYFFAVTNYFLYGESIIYYFKHVVFADAQLLPFATNHRMISFTLYTIGFMGFVMSLKKGYLKQQFGLFCWVHMSLLLIVASSHFIVNNILEGLIWFWVPASLVICNDCFAYIWGVTVGRTPLIKLSPKKTVEGFVGAFISTVIFAVFWGTYFMNFDYMICPVQDLGVSAWSSMQCTPNPVFVWRTITLWRPVAVFITTLVGHSVTTISYAPYQLHLLLLACFASLVAPFGGFFASGFKRAFNIKDFGHSIPGHGGMTDRMDCQFLMGVFTYVYYSSLIRVHRVTVGGILQTIVSSLTVEQQLEIIRDLTRYLEKQGIVVP
ncbi:hypothetical protein BYT27DRAFT_7240645 [Phlegmacium glaucopus]|nr:hypothetical protein BYT27DRAFT_7240645 [Phlegmacium glaucopus]